MRSSILRRLPFSVALLVAGIAALPSTAQAAPKKRVAFNVQGDFVLVGNTLGQDCAAGVGVPVPPAVVGACGTNVDDSAIDVFWRSQNTTALDALADVSLTADQARSTSVL